MKKRNQILAGVLAVLLGVSPSGVYGEAFYDVEDVADTDAAAQEITDVQDEESEQPEEVLDVKIIEDTEKKELTPGEALELADQIRRGRRPEAQGFARVKEAYERYGGSELLSAICSILIKNGSTDEESFSWYRRGVELELKLHETAEDALENAEVVYEASGLSSAAGVRPFDFSIRKGEVNGFTGLLGSGRSESVRAIFGADHVSSGTVKMGGKLVKITSPLAAMKHGISYLPEDRKRDGIIGDLSVRDNIILARQVLDGFFHPISKAKAEKYAEEYIRLLSIKTASTDTPIKSLSGGNQQKVILARWLLANPVYMILDEPTRGIDVGTKVEIQKLVLQLAAEGKSVTFISSEIDEMLRVCSRLIVMRDRQVVGELRGSDLNQSSIMKTIAGGEQA